MNHYMLNSEEEQTILSQIQTQLTQHELSELLTLFYHSKSNYHPLPKKEQDRLKKHFKLENDVDFLLADAHQLLSLGNYNDALQFTTRYLFSWFL